MSHADDSGGDLGTCISRALQGIRTVADELTGSRRTRLIERVLDEALTDPYQGWDLIEIAADIVENADERTKVDVALEDMACRREDRDSAFLSDFDKKRAAMIRLSLVERLDSCREHETFLRNRINWTEFRIKLVDHLIERGDLEESKRLCEEWLAEPGHNRRGHRSEILGRLLWIAVDEGNIADEIRLTECLLLETGQTRYVKRLKALNEADWSTYRHQLLQMLASSRNSAVTADVYVIEEMWPEPLAYVSSQHRYAIDHYREHLDPRFPEQMSQLYERIALQVLTQEVNRKG